MASAAPRVQVQAQARTRGRSPGNIAEQAAALVGARPCFDCRNMHTLASLGDDGFLTRQSSPFVMWLASRLAAQ